MDSFNRALTGKAFGIKRTVGKGENAPKEQIKFTLYPLAQYPNGINNESASRIPPASILPNVSETYNFTIETLF